MRAKRGISEMRTTNCEHCGMSFSWQWRTSRPNTPRWCSRRCQVLFVKPWPVKHGEGSTGKMSRTWVTWHNMLQRCNDPNAPNYPRYGGRGITICDRWQGRDGFINFKADMGERPEGKTLDRWPNRDGNYEPGNCRWATAKEQSANRDKARANQTHCRNGHEYSVANTYTYPNGRQVCHVCKIAATRRSNERISMNKFLRKAKKSVQVFHNEELAQDAVEYALLALLIALGAISGMTTLARSINAEFNTIAGKLS